MAIRTVFHLELTELCNYNCSFCKTVRRQEKNVMDYELAIRALDALSETPVHGIYLNSVQLNGNGEPLLYPRLCDVIREARKRFSMAEFVTNGSLMTEDKIDALLKTGIDMIEISLTGIRPEVYQHFQGSGVSYEACERNLRKVIENVKLLAKKRDETNAHTYIRLRYIRSRKLGSYSHLKEYINFWRDTGVDEIFVTALWDMARKPSYDNKRKLKVIRCHCMNSPMVAKASGNVFSCANNHDTNRWAVGNVKETPMKEIITSERFIKEKADKMTCDLKRVPKTCLSCEARALRSFWEEVRNMRRRIFLKKPLRTLCYIPFGIVVMCYERFNRWDWFHKLFWRYMCYRSKKIHDAFHNNMHRTAGEKS